MRPSGGAIPARRFGPAQPITELDTAVEEDYATLTADELTIYFSSTRVGSVGGYDLFTASRPDRTAVWGNIQVVGGVNTAANERAPIVSADQRTLYAHTGSLPDQQIGVTTRTTAAGLFNGFTDVAALNAAGSTDKVGTLLENAIYISSDRDGGNYQILRAPRAGSAFGPPLVVSGNMLDLTSIDAQPVVTPDELTIYFESDRTGGFGSYDIWMARRSSLADGFGTPVNLSSLNSTAADFPTWISADNCVLYFTSRSPGNYDFYQATRGQ